MRTEHSHGCIVEDHRCMKQATYDRTPCIPWLDEAWLIVGSDDSGDETMRRWRVAELPLTEMRY